MFGNRTWGAVYQGILWYLLPSVKLCRTTVFEGVRLIFWTKNNPVSHCFKPGNYSESGHWNHSDLDSYPTDLGTVPGPLSVSVRPSLNGTDKSISLRVLWELKDIMPAKLKHCLTNKNLIYILDAFIIINNKYYSMDSKDFQCPLQFLTYSVYLNIWRTKKFCNFILWE